MKKFFVTIFTLMFVVLVVGSVYAGPIDWLADKLGYVPEAQLVAAQAETAKAVAAAQTAATAAEQSAATAARSTTYGIVLTAILGGLAIFRKKIAKKVLKEKPKAEPEEG